METQVYHALPNLSKNLTDLVSEFAAPVRKASEMKKQWVEEMESKLMKKHNREYYDELDKKEMDRLREWSKQTNVNKLFDDAAIYLNENMKVIRNEFLDAGYKVLVHITSEHHIGTRDIGDRYFAVYAVGVSAWEV